MHSEITLHKQNGAVLLVSLIILLIMTVIGTSGITSVTMEERMVSNMYDDNLSFQASETGLRDCEDNVARQNIDPKLSLIPVDIGILDGTAEGSWTGSTGFWWQDFTFFEGSGKQYTDTVTNEDGSEETIDMTALAHGAVAANPYCVLEEIYFQADDKQDSVLTKTGWYTYEGTAAAKGADSRSMSVVQSAYFKRYK